jgi:hypothetical protein
VETGTGTSQATFNYQHKEEEHGHRQQNHHPTSLQEKQSQSAVVAGFGEIAGVLPFFLLS